MIKIYKDMKPQYGVDVEMGYAQEILNQNTAHENTFLTFTDRINGDPVCKFAVIVNKKEKYTGTFPKASCKNKIIELACAAAIVFGAKKPKLDSFILNFRWLNVLSLAQSSTEHKKIFETAGFTFQEGPIPAYTWGGGMLFKQSTGTKPIVEQGMSLTKNPPFPKWGKLKFPSKVEATKEAASLARTIAAIELSQKTMGLIPHSKYGYVVPLMFTEKTSKLKLLTINQGQTLSGIAKKQYGDARLWTYLFAYNDSKIWNPKRIRLGTKIKIPSVQFIKDFGNQIKTVKYLKNIKIVYPSFVIPILNQNTSLWKILFEDKGSDKKINQ